MARYEGPLKTLLSQIEYIGMKGTAFALRVSREQREQLLAQPTEMKKFEEICKEELGITSKYLPAYTLVFN